MVRLRRLLHRFIKPAAMVGAVGILSLSLVVTTPSNAQAFADGDDLAKVAPRIMGAVKTAAPGVLAVATSVTPTGWAVKGLWMLGMLALDTSDMWLPYVTGKFGGSPEDNNVTQTGTKVSHTLTGVSQSGNTLTLTYSNSSVPSGGSMGWYAHFGAIAKCKSTTTGSIGYWHKGGYWSYGSNPPASWTNTATLTNMCPTGYTMTGYVGGGGNPGGAPTFSPNLDTSKAGAPAQFDGLASQYNFASRNLQYGGDMAQQVFNPNGSDVGYQGQSECIEADGTVSWISAETTAGSAGAVKMPSCAAAGKGHGTGASRVIAFKPDGTQQPVWEMPRPASDPSTPLCDTALPSSGCTLEVLKDDQPCVAGDVECENWASEKSKDPTRWKCKFGPYNLPLSACNLLEQAYRIGGAIATEKNTDGDPSTQDNNSYSGQPVPQPAPAPVMQAPGTTTGTAPVPGGSGQPSPSADAPARSCWPTGWAAFNPLEWVLKPLGCAFIPSKDIDARTKELAQRARLKAPISWLSMPLQGPGGGGCPNWTINVAGLSQNVVCGSSFTAAITGVRGPLFGIVAAAMLWPLLRSLWYAAIPILRVTPSSGGK